jgi:hypothetical protein
MPKGEKIKAKSEKWISYHLRDFENNRIELFGLSKLFYCLVKTLLLSPLSKVGFLWGEVWIMVKRGVFEILNQFLLESLSLCFKHVCLT